MINQDLRSVAEEVLGLVFPDWGLVNFEALGAVVVLHVAPLQRRCISAYILPAGCGFDTEASADCPLGGYPPMGG